MENAFLHDCSSVLKKLEVDPNQGLTDAQVTKNRETYGANELPESERKHLGLFVYACVVVVV